VCVCVCVCVYRELLAEIKNSTQDARYVHKNTTCNLFNKVLRLTGASGGSNQPMFYRTTPSLSLQF